MANYPKGIWAPTTKRGWYHILWAAHMNDLQAEIDAAQQTFGINPHRATMLPGGLTRDYGTVEQRTTEHARGSDTPFYRGQAANVSLTANEWNTITFLPMSDPYKLGNGAGHTITLNETGMWLLTARAEYRATGHTLSKQARRKLRILIDDVDVGLRDFTAEKEENAFALHNHVSWPEVLESGTELKVQVRTDVDAPEHTMLTNVVFRAYLIRTTGGVVTESSLRALVAGEA